MAEAPRELCERPASDALAVVGAAEALNECASCACFCVKGGEPRGALLLGV